MDFKLKTWVSKIKLKSQIGSTETKKTLSYFKTSIISIIVGFILTSILIAALGVDPLQFFLKSFNVVFTRNINLNDFLAWCSIYALFGIGLAIGFKVGLFNMSGSGQAILSMGISGLVLISLFGDQVGINKAGPEILILILIIMVVMSMLLSSITGILKVVFNIHEVATSILLNWTIWYILKWAFKRNWVGVSTPLIPASWILSFGGSKWLLPIILTVIVFVSAWFVLTFTTVGYKFKLVGAQKDAASYVGINFKLYIVAATALQGLCIGLGSFVYWVSIKKGYPTGDDVIPTIGFDAIAVSLIAFNNILGIIPIASLWALLQVGMPAAVPAFPELSREIAPLVFGFIVYSSTFASLFMRLKIIKWSKFKIYIFKDFGLRKTIKLKKQDIKELKKQMKQLKKQGFSLFEFFKQKKDIHSISNQNNEKLIVLNRKKQDIESEIHELKESGFIKFEETSYEVIEKKEINKHKLKTIKLKKQDIKEIKKEMKQLKKQGFSLFEFFKQKKDIHSISNQNNEKLIVLNRDKKDIESEIHELKESGFIKFEETSYKAIKMKYINKHKRNTYNLLNKAIQELNVVEEEKTLSLQKIKEIKKDKNMSIEEKKELVTYQKELLKKTKLVNKEIDLAWKQIIVELSISKKTLFEERDENIKLAKQELNNTISESVELLQVKIKNFKLEKQELNRTIAESPKLSKEEIKNFKLEKQELNRTIAESVSILKEKGKILKFKKLMELGEKYGCN